MRTNSRESLASRSQRFATVRFPSKRGTRAGPAVPAVRRDSQIVLSPAVSPGAARAAGRLLTVREAAERLAVSTATVYALCDRGEFPHVRGLQLHPWPRS